MLEKLAEGPEADGRAARGATRENASSRQMPGGSRQRRVGSLGAAARIRREKGERARRSLSSTLLPQSDITQSLF